MLNFLITSKYRKVFIDIFNEKVGALAYRILGFLLAIFLARILGPLNYGAYTVTISIAFLLSTLFDLGVPAAILKYLPNMKDREERRALINMLLGIQIIFNLLFVGVLLMFTEKFIQLFFKDVKYQLFVLFSFIIAVLMSIRKTVDAVFQSNERFDLIRDMKIFEGIFKLLFIILLTLIFGVFGSVLGFFLAYISLLLAAVFYLRNLGLEIGKIKSSIKISKVKLFKYLFLANFASLTRSAHGWIDSILISALLDLKSVGFYRVANSLIGALIGFTSLQSIFAPRISRWDISTIKRNLIRIFMLNLAVTLPIFLIINLFAENLLLYLYGPEYISVSPLLRILSMVLIFNSFSYFTLIFTLKGKPQYSILTAFIMTISNAILDYILILKVGLTGAVWATVISWILSLVFAAFLFKIKFG